MADSSVNLIQDPYDQSKPGQSGAPNSQTGASPVAPVDPGASSSGGAGGSGPSAPGSSGSGPSTSKTGTGFVNIQNVLNANKGTGQQLGNAIGSGINQQVSNVGQQLGQAQNTFGAAANAGIVGSASDQSSAQNIISSIVGNGTPGSGYQATGVNTVGSGSTTPPANTGTTQYQQAGPAPANGPNGFPTTQNSNANPWTPAQISAYQQANPTPATGQDLSTPLDAGLTGAQVSQFGKLLAGNYTGPQGLTGIDQLNQQAQQVQSLGQNVNTSGGQQQLLQQFVGGNNANYGSGAQGLDQLLLGQGGAQPLQSAAQNTLALPGQISGTQNAAQNTATEDTALSSQFGNNLKSQLTAAQAGILAQAQAQQAAASASDAALAKLYGTTVANDLSATTETTDQKSAGLSQSQANAANALAALSGSNSGLTPDQYQQLQTLITQGYIDPNSQANAAYEAYQKSGATGPVQGSGIFAGSQIAAPTPVYTSLAAAGIDPATLLKNNISFTGAQGSSANAFLTPSQQAQLNAISQLQGQSQNALTQNVPTYQAATGSINFANLMNKINTDSNLNAGPQSIPSSSDGGGGSSPLGTIGNIAIAANPFLAVPASIGGWHLAYGGIVPESPKFNKLSQMFKRK